MDDLVAESLPPWRRLDPRYVVMARQAAMVRLLVLAVVGAGICSFLRWAMEWSATATLRAVFAAALLLLAYGVLGLVLPAIRYRHSAWRLSGDGLELRKGAWWRSETRIPLTRIQHTDVRQGPLERRHGLGTVAVFTAGTHLNAIELGGVAHSDAMALRDELIGSGAAPI